MLETPRGKKESGLTGSPAVCDEDRFAKVLELADTAVAGLRARMRWMWGEALFGYALTELDAELGEDRYLPFTKAYCDWYMERPPRVDQSDTAAPALLTWAMQKRFPGAGYGLLTDRVLDYLKNEPRLKLKTAISGGTRASGEAINHLGHSPESRFYPKSLWVDSLMMTGVFAARYASETGDRGLLDFAAGQASLYASLLQDPGTGLWRHSYWIRAARAHPESGLYWARGNGWVIASLPMILDFLPGEHPERTRILGLLARTSAALLPFQRTDGWFDTILERQGNSYRESSATALVAAGWMHALRRGWLDEGFREPALKAFRSVADSLERSPGGRLAMPEISGPTIPLPLFPRAGYRFVPKGKNIPYGLAALILAGIECRKLESRPSPWTAQFPSG
jgi:unsaturated rhamnogalacturonyl hydrolase